MKRIFSLIVIVTLVLSLMACDSKDGAAAVIGHNIGDLAYDIVVENVDGEEVKLSDFRGKKVFLLAWTST